MPSGNPQALKLRIASALLLAPLPVAAIWFGSPWLGILTIFAAAIMGWEWDRLCCGDRFGSIGIILIGAVLASVGTAAVAGAGYALVVTAAAAGCVFWAARGKENRDAEWSAVGVLWIALPCVAFLWLGESPATHRETLLWVIAVVWATDIGAYAVGRAIGGPRLAPRWSPRKTWSGLFGGIACAGLVGWVTVFLLRISPALPLVSTSAALAIIAQLGDLAESAAKRKFGVKDSSGLIPGHGGFLDRLDGLLAVIPVVALLTLIGGRSVLLWR